MTLLKKASDAAAITSEHSTASGAILEPARRIPAGDRHATPWDEPSRDWGRRGYGPVRAMRKTYRREVLFGTW